MNKTYFIFTLLFLVLFGACAWAVHAGLFQFADAFVQTFFELHPQSIFGTKTFIAITDVGSPPALLFIFLVALYALKRDLYKVLWSNLIISFAAFGILLQFCKTFFSLERPETSIITVLGYGFPSGHAAFAIFSLFLSAWAISLSVRARMRKNILIALLAVGALLIAVSRLYLQVHYLSDIIGGIFLGAAFACFFLSYSRPRMVGYANGKNS